MQERPCHSTGTKALQPTRSDPSRSTALEALYELYITYNISYVYLMSILARVSQAGDAGRGSTVSQPNACSENCACALLSKHLCGLSGTNVAGEGCTARRNPATAQAKKYVYV
jgi:hypothetical protein